jgi:IAA-amino acid hydrolase
MAASHAAGFGCNGTVDWRLDEQPYYPPVVNDDGAADFAWGVAERLFGPDKVGGGGRAGGARWATSARVAARARPPLPRPLGRSQPPAAAPSWPPNPPPHPPTPQVLETEPIMPAEDFAFFARAVPATFVFLGIRNETAGSVHNLHSRNFTLDESALHRGAALHAALAVEYLARGGVEGGAFGAEDARRAAEGLHTEL